jgi:hypothetical protein
VIGSEYEQLRLLYLQTQIQYKGEKNSISLHPQETLHRPKISIVLITS